MTTNLDIQVLEAGPEELTRLVLLSKPKDPIYVYSQVLLAYWRGRAKELHSCSSLLPHLDPSSVPNKIFLQKLIELRYSIRTRQQNDSLIDEASPQLPPLWCGEYHFILAMYFETFDDDLKALNHYLESQKLFYLSGAHKKAAKAYHNSVACQSRINPERRLIAEYQTAATWAREAREFSTLGAALNNLSREFYLMGATSLALKFSNESVDTLRSSAYGSYQFYLALCHRCHLYLEKNYFQKALLDFQEASASELSEIKAALQILKDKLKNVDDIVLPNKGVEYALPKTWAERKENFSLDSDHKLTDSETKVIEILIEGPADRHQLISRLWGDRENFFYLENRLKQLLHRLRKKHPRLIDYENGHYFLIDNSKLENPLRKMR